MRLWGKQTPKTQDVPNVSDYERAARALTRGNVATREYLAAHARVPTSARTSEPIVWKNPYEEDASVQGKLLAAIVRRDAAEVALLLAAGASPDDPPAGGDTPLHVVADIQSVQIAELLLAAGADIHKLGCEGDTPLHTAVDTSIDGTNQSGGMPGDEPTEMIEFLLAHGANPHARDERGETPLDWAREYKSEKVTHLLQAKLDAG
jgi:ankyrin repeat protein